MRTIVRLVVLGALGVLALLLSMELWVIAATNSAIYYSVAAVPKEEVALVLGASIKSTGELSPVLRERADAALALYDAGTVQKILVSGDDSTLRYDEVYPVGKYLLSHGVPQADIFLDYAGFDTYSSMYRAKHIFGATSMVIASQRFHLPRALFLAHAMGIEAVGLDAAAPGEKYFNNAVREIPATAKSIVDVLIGRAPQYLGPQYFVTGDSAPTWIGPKAEMLYFKGAR